MIIQTPDPEKHLVHDYDITLTSGFLMQLTVDETVGDTIHFGSEHTQIKLTAKPSRINPDEVMPAEDITVFSQHILVVNHKTRLVAPITTEDSNNWLAAFKGAKSTVQ